MPKRNCNLSAAALLIALILAGGPAALGQTVNVLGFDARRNGLKFPNTKWPDVPPWKLHVPLIGNVSVGTASSGLCGGMAYMVRDCFDANLLPPDTSVNPPPGSPLFTYIVARLGDSCDYEDANQEIIWITRSDSELAKLMVEQEWPKIKSVIDSGEPCPLDLAYGHAAPSDLTGIIHAIEKCHQVLAYGYTIEGYHLTVRIWDPNLPSYTRSTIRMSLDDRNLTDDSAKNWTTITGYGTKFRGFYRGRYTFHDPRQPTAASFIVEAASSPGVSGLEPLPPVALERTWAKAARDPLAHFTADVHDLTIPITEPQTDNGQPIQQLMVTITTGNAPLRGGAEPNDNADIFLSVGKHLGGGTLYFHNINCNQPWNAGESDRVILPLPPGAASGDILSLRLHTQFDAADPANNSWIVNSISATGYLPLPAGG